MKNPGCYSPEILILDEGKNCLFAFLARTPL